MVHQAVAIMYCTQQVIQGENFRNWLKNRKSFPLESFAADSIWLFPPRGIVKIAIKISLLHWMIVSAFPSRFQPILRVFSYNE